MKKIKTLNSLTIIVFMVVLSFSSSLFAQSERTTEKSTIVMTKSELNSFLTTIADARRAQLDKRDKDRLNRELAELRLKYRPNPSSNYLASSDISNQDIMRELLYMRQRLDNLDVNNTGIPTSYRDNVTVVVPKNTSQNAGYRTNSTATTANKPTNSKQIARLQATIDSLRVTENAKFQLSNSSAYGDSLVVTNTRLNNVRRQLEILELKMKASKGNKTVVNPVLDRSYFKQQVYFENNSEEVQAEYYQKVQELTQILIQYPEAKILLEGWASPLGKTTYNKLLSMSRAEAVKKVFVNNNIEANRVLVSFKGEDNNSSAQHARRVDMSIIVR